MDGEPQPLNLSQFRKEPLAIPDLEVKEVSTLNPEEYAEYLATVARSANPETVVPQLGDIADRFGADLEKVDPNSEDSLEKENMTGKLTVDVIWRLAHTEPPVKVDNEVIEKFYLFTKDPHQLKRIYAMSYLPVLISLDLKNGVDSLNIRDRFVEDLKQEILAHNPTENNDIPELLAEARDNMPHKLEEFLIRSLELTQDDQEILKIFVAYSNATSFNEMRRAMLNYSQRNPDFQEVLKRTEKVTGITLGDEAEIHSDNNSFYRNMNKEDYEPYNKLTDSEVEFLVKQTVDDEDILDVGSGTGRILIPLSKHNRNVSGIDISEDDVMQVNSYYPNIRNEVGSWHHIDRETGSFDAIYSFARSPLHNSTPQEWLSMLKEFNRVLRDTSKNGSSKGRVYLDIPDNDSAHYSKHTSELYKKLKKIGINRVFRNSMIDTPDQKNYIDRLSPDPDQLTAMAALTGFNARQIASKEYHDDEGNTVTNNYWQLTKTDRILSDEERNEAMRVAFSYAGEDTSRESNIAA